MAADAQKKTSRTFKSIMDFVFIRHAERALITTSHLKNGTQPQITLHGKQESRLLGKKMRESLEFNRGKYDFVECYASSLRRTHETALNILKGIGIKNIIRNFAKQSDEYSDQLLRLKPDNQHWSEKKVAEVANKMLKKNSPFYKNVLKIAKQNSKEFEALNVLSELEDLMNRDNSRLYIALLPLVKKSKATQIAKEMSIYLYDHFIDSKETELYLNRPIRFIKEKISEYRNSHMQNVLLLGVTHDFNLTGLIKGMIYKGSLKRLGGIPGYLSILHVQVGLIHNTVNNINILYNGKKFKLNPQIEKILKSN